MRGNHRNGGPTQQPPPATVVVSSTSSMRPPPPPPPPRARASNEGKGHHEEPTSSIPDLEAPLLAKQSAYARYRFRLSDEQQKSQILRSGVNLCPFLFLVTSRFVAVTVRNNGTIISQPLDLFLRHT
ncbi:hypothetical protein WN48_10557 [Eufriesea mexicana]|nr:hypothetical protein WN48_10557 [Eufriesea mexicana]